MSAGGVSIPQTRLSRRPLLIGAAVFTVVAASIVLHGVSATPLMELYRSRRGAGRSAEVSVSDK